MVRTKPSQWSPAPELSVLQVPVGGGIPELRRRFCLLPPDGPNAPERMRKMRPLRVDRRVATIYQLRWESGDHSSLTGGPKNRMCRFYLGTQISVDASVFGYLFSILLGQAIETISIVTGTSEQQTRWQIAQVDELPKEQTPSTVNRAKSVSWPELVAPGSGHQRHHICICLAQWGDDAWSFQTAKNNVVSWGTSLFGDTNFELIYVEVSHVEPLLSGPKDMISFLGYIMKYSQSLWFHVWLVAKMEFQSQLQRRPRFFGFLLRPWRKPTWDRSEGLKGLGAPVWKSIEGVSFSEQMMIFVGATVGVTNLGVFSFLMVPLLMPYMRWPIRLEILYYISTSLIHIDWREFQRGLGVDLLNPKKIQNKKSKSFGLQKLVRV